MPVPMSSLFGGQMPPGATVQPSAPAPQPGMPMPGPAGQPGGNNSEMMAQLIALLLQDPQFAQAVAQERAKRQLAGPQGPMGAPPMPGQAQAGPPAPQPGGGGSRFSEALQQLRRR